MYKYFKHIRKKLSFSLNSKLENLPLNEQGGMMSLNHNYQLIYFWSFAKYIAVLEVILCEGNCALKNLG